MSLYQAGWLTKNIKFVKYFGLRFELSRLLFWSLHRIFWNTLVPPEYGLMACPYAETE